MGRKRNVEPPPGPAPTPAIDHLFDGDADPAGPLRECPPDVDLDLPSLEDGAI